VHLGDALSGITIGGVTIGGKGFIDAGFVDLSGPFPVFINTNPTAMEIGPDGSAALGISGLKPHIYCTGDAVEFPENGGAPPAFLREFQIYVGNLTTASSDPFPVP
jgi:hypothetical protein